VELLECRTLLSVMPVGTDLFAGQFAGYYKYEGVARDAAGDFVVVASNNPGSGYDVYARRYNANGVPQGEVFQVNSYTTGNQAMSTVAMDADGDFVITWLSELSANLEHNGIYAQRYNAAGVPQGGEFRPSDTELGPKWLSVGMAGDGAFVIAWEALTNDFWEIHAQRYNAAGVPQGGIFTVNSYRLDAQLSPDVAVKADGSFVIAWNSNGQDGSGYGIFAQRYSSTGAKQGGEFRVNTFTTGDQFYPKLATNDAGDFVVTWQDFSSHGFAQRYSDDGLPLGGELPLAGAAQDVAMSGDREFYITFSGSGVGAQSYNSDGTPDGPPLTVGSLGVVALDGDDNPVFAWGGAGADGFGMYARRYAVVPEVTGSSFLYATAPHQLRFTFNHDVSASLGTNDLVVQNLTTMQTISSGDFSISYDTLNNVATFTYTGTTAGIAGMLPDGNYTATLIASGIATPQGAPLATDHVLTFHFLQADANNDGHVNLADFNILASNFGQSPRTFSQGDFNYDTIVNLADFNILASRFGTSIGPSQITSFGVNPIGAIRHSADENEALVSMLE
jgi:hypothetical protein